MKARTRWLAGWVLLMVISVIAYFLAFRPAAEKAAESVALLENTVPLEIRYDYRQGATLKSGQPLMRDLVIPTNGHLWFSFGVPHSQRESGPFRFLLRTKSPIEKTLYSKELLPSVRKQDRVWTECELDLSEFSGKKVRLSFEFESGNHSAIGYLAQGKVAGIESDEKRWNVVLITIDTLRRDHVSAYGYSRFTTPEMDRFAQRASVFLNAFSAAPLTVPSMTSIFTSTYYSQHQVTNNRSSFDGRFPLLAEVLKRNGYTTAAFIGNAVLRPNRKLDAGFDVYNAYLPSSEINRRLPERNAGQLNHAALAWLNSHFNERFFLWLHYQDPHAPYTPPSGFDTLFDPTSPSAVRLKVIPDETGNGGIPDYARIPGVFDPEVYQARYDAEIHYADSKIGEVLKTIQDLSIADRTMIVVTSDHGESLGERNHYYAHGHNVSPELTDVPLLVFVPGRPSSRLSQTVSTIDIAPTILRLVELPVPKGFRGEDLFLNSPNRFVYSEQPAVKWALIRDNRRIVYERTGGFDQPEEKDSKQDRSALQDWIASHLENGCVFAFFGAAVEGVSVVSADRLKRAYLFGGEEGDRAEVERNSVSIHLRGEAGDVDYLFVEPTGNADLKVEGATGMRNRMNQILPASFTCESVPEATALPEAGDFPSPGIIVIRKRGAASAIRLTPEEEEEMKSIGYVNQ